MVCYFLFLEKGPKIHFEPIYIELLAWFTYHPVEAAQHQKIKTDELGINGPKYFVTFQSNLIHLNN